MAEPGEERSYRLEVGVLEGAEEISAFEDRVDAIPVSPPLARLRTATKRRSSSCHRANNAACSEQAS